MSQELSEKISKMGGTLATISTSKIRLVDRYRKDYGNLQDLAESITRLGQLQNVVVRKLEDETDQPYILLAGGRRFRAMTEVLNKDKINALIFKRDLSEIELLEIELEENSKRKDMDWKEECAIKSKIHELKVDTHGEKIAKTPDAAGWSMGDTAKLLNKTRAEISQDIKLHKAVAAAPEIFAQCKNKSEARKLLNTAQEALIRTELARRAQASIQSDDYQGNARLREMDNRYVVGDFFERILELPDSCMDFVEIDPPYAIDLQRVKQRDTNTIDAELEAYNEISIDNYPSFMARVIENCDRVMRDDSWILIWHATEWRDLIYRLCLQQGFQGNMISGKWIKPNGQCQHPDKYLANACEEFLYLRKGDPKIIRAGRSNIFPFSPVPPQRKIHPTQRPQELIREILSTFCVESQKVLVPFAGSGATIIAAESLHMQAVGFDLTKRYKENYLIFCAELFGKISLDEESPI